MRKLLVKQLRVITGSTKAASQIYSPFDGGGGNIKVWDRSAFFSTVPQWPVTVCWWKYHPDSYGTVFKPARVTLMPVSTILTVRRCGFEHSPCSCFFNVESMKGHTSLEKTAFWSALMPPLGRQVFRAQHVPERSRRVSCSFIRGKGQRCVAQDVMAILLMQF